MSSLTTWDDECVNGLAKFWMVSVAADQYLISCYFNLAFLEGGRVCVACQSLVGLLCKWNYFQAVSWHLKVSHYNTDWKNTWFFYIYVLLLKKKLLFFLMCLSTEWLQQKIPFYSSQLCKCLCPLILLLFFRCRIMYVVWVIAVLLFCVCSLLLLDALCCTCSVS